MLYQLSYVRIIVRNSAPQSAFPRVPTSKNSIGGSGNLQIAPCTADMAPVHPCILGVLTNYRLVISSGPSLGCAGWWRRQGGGATPTRSRRRPCGVRDSYGGPAASLAWPSRGRCLRKLLDFKYPPVWASIQWHWGDWRSGSALRSHRRGHWFEPSIAHPNKWSVPLPERGGPFCFRSGRRATALLLPEACLGSCQPACVAGRGGILALRSMSDPRERVLL